ncbi:hypothetical protein TBLA_0D01650 [Henningerozyma blattae CBS 6284]|uniref:Association with the SNF1 complex (ASC) domain-containing protein n=1 Tax=Henningerozyma blattae (strain ATCC 34711 / CBS 6284 / DSM 70876 / NBRC 10599 / NRRL Y-10934 / UCD 77-7) TaxID=1071380 RepID=I2H2S1_HENB6|nr:hypothetical protein TBLA_0D01650 [Tetrapisispora blattae CBS 6284]CCH60673.1 hypothetical protein TBLA_0D01650 [Tetrapisispora blattae CBS 6284]
MGNNPSILDSETNESTNRNINNNSNNNNNSSTLIIERNDSITSTLFPSRSSSSRQKYLTKNQGENPNNVSLFKQNYSLTQNNETYEPILKPLSSPENDTNITYNNSTFNNSRASKNSDQDIIRNDNDPINNQQQPLLILSPGPSHPTVEQSKQQANYNEDQEMFKNGITQTKNSSSYRNTSPNIPSNTNNIINMNSHNYASSHRPSVVALKKSLEETLDFTTNDPRQIYSSRSSQSSFSTMSNTRSASIDIPTRNSASRVGSQYFDADFNVPRFENDFLHPDEPALNQKLIQNMLTQERRKDQHNNQSFFTTDTTNGIPNGLTNSSKHFRDEPSASSNKIQNTKRNNSLNLSSQFDIDMNDNTRTNFIRAGADFKNSKDDANRTISKLLRDDTDVTSSTLIQDDGDDDDILLSRKSVAFDQETSGDQTLTFKPSTVSQTEMDVLLDPIGISTRKSKRGNVKSNKKPKAFIRDGQKIYPGEDEDDEIVETITSNRRNNISSTISKPLSRIDDGPNNNGFVTTTRSSSNSSQKNLANLSRLTSIYGNSEEFKPQSERKYKPLQTVDNKPYKHLQRTDSNNHDTRSYKPLQRVTSNNSSSGKLNLKRLSSLEAPSKIYSSRELLRQLSSRSSRIGSLKDQLDSPSDLSKVTSYFSTDTESAAELQNVIIKYRDPMEESEIPETKIQLISKDINTTLHYDTTDLLTENNKMELVYNKDEKAWILPNLMLPPGIYQVQFLVNSDLKHSDFLPTATDDFGNIVNWFEVLSGYDFIEPFRDENISSADNSDGTLMQNIIPEKLKTISMTKMAGNGSKGSTPRSNYTGVSRSNSLSASSSSSVWKSVNVNLFTPLEPNKVEYSTEIPEIFKNTTENNTSNAPMQYHPERKRPGLLHNVVDCSQEELFGDLLADGLMDTETAEQMFLDKYPVPELPIYLNSKYMTQIVGEINQPSGSGPPSSLNNNDLNHIIPHVNLQHLLTSSIREEMISVACTTRYEGKFLTQILYTPCFYENLKSGENNELK